METSEAFEVLKKALKDDSDYAHSWHCNIAMMCQDAIRKESDLQYKNAPKIGNDAASRFMKLCFDVETKS